ncbi:MAG: DUF4197 family protein [Flavobacteriales bacterium]|nr:DUF4197 family protein [Flavobacteriales bacterium]
MDVLHVTRDMNSNVYRPALNLRTIPVPCSHADAKASVVGNPHPLAIPMASPIRCDHSPDLDRYVTQKAIDGLFVLIADEEARIRMDPAARTSDLLRRVFGN